MLSVGHDDIDSALARLELKEALGAIGRVGHGEARSLEQAARLRPHAGLVLDEEHASSTPAALRDILHHGDGAGQLAGLREHRRG